MSDVKEVYELFGPNGIMPRPIWQIMAEYKTTGLGIAVYAVRRTLGLPGVPDSFTIEDAVNVEQHLPKEMGQAVLLLANLKLGL